MSGKCGHIEVESCPGAVTPTRRRIPAGAVRADTSGVRPGRRCPPSKCPAAGDEITNVGAIGASEAFHEFGFCFLERVIEHMDVEAALCAHQGREKTDSAGTGDEECRGRQSPRRRPTRSVWSHALASVLAGSSRTPSRPSLYRFSQRTRARSATALRRSRADP